MPTPKFKEGEKRPESAGRKKGSKNKKTLMIQAFVESVVNKRHDKFLQELDKLKAKDFVNAYMNLLEFVQPKLQRIESKHTQSPTINIFMLPAEKPKLEQQNTIKIILVEIIVFVLLKTYLKKQYFLQNRQ